MDPTKNLFMRQNVGAPPPEQGPMGLFLPNRKLITPGYLPSRWERLKIRGWIQFFLPIPSDFPGMIQLDGGEAQEFSAQTPSYFALIGFNAFWNQPEGATIDLYEMDTEQSLVSTSGPSLHIENLGGLGRHPSFLKEFFFMDPGDSLLATVSNQSGNPGRGQIVAVGFAPMIHQVQPAPTGPPTGVPFFELVK
jgi:hypothetical protein